jgi:hypothetical protein
MPKKTSYEGEIIRDGEEKHYYVESLAALYALIRTLDDYDEMTILCKGTGD